MPSSTPKQARFMAAIAHNPGFAKRVGVPQSVGRDFNAADAGTGILSKRKARPGTRFNAKKTRRYTGA